MLAGRLRHRVRLQERVPAQNSFGEEVESWVNVATVWASIEDVRGREFLEARQQLANVTTRVRMRQRAVSPGMRVLWTDGEDAVHVFDVEAVQVDATRRREVVLMCAAAA